MKIELDCCTDRCAHTLVGFVVSPCTSLCRRYQNHESRLFEQALEVKSRRRNSSQGQGTIVKFKSEANWAWRAWKQM